MLFGCQLILALSSFNVTHTFFLTHRVYGFVNKIKQPVRKHLTSIQDIIEARKLHSTVTETTIQ